MTVTMAVVQLVNERPGRGALLERFVEENSGGGKG